MELQPSHCSCSHPFSVEHALNSKTGGFPAVRHNEVRDNHITASLLSEVCHGVTTEPICIHSQEKLCHIALQLQMMVLIWTLLCMVSGEEDLRRHFWMSGCSTLSRKCHACTVSDAGLCRDDLAPLIDTLDALRRAKLR